MNKDKFRIREQFGKFYIEKEIRTEIKIETSWSKVLPMFFKPKISVDVSWWSVSTNGSVSSFMNQKAQFNSIEKAKKCIKEFELKYHNL